MCGCLISIKPRFKGFIIINEWPIRFLGEPVWGYFFYFNCFSSF